MLIFVMAGTAFAAFAFAIAMTVPMAAVIAAGSAGPASRRAAKIFTVLREAAA